MLLHLLTLALGSAPNSPGHCVGTDLGHFMPDGSLNCGTCIGREDMATDCAWRKLALDMATAKLGAHVGGSVYDALQLQGLCKTPPPPPSASSDGHQPLPLPVDTIYARAPSAKDGVRAAATADGSAARPFATLEAARDAARARNGRGATTTIALSGVFHRRAPLNLTREDGSTRWTASAQPGAAPAVISGAVPLKNLRWAPSAMGVFVATLPER